MIILFRILLTLSSTSLFILVFLVKSKISLFNNVNNYLEWLSYLIYFLCVFLLNLIVLWLIKFLEEDSLQSYCNEKINIIKKVELANHTFLPTYLGYFFVALSIKDADWVTFSIIYFIVFIFTFFSQTNYFNPIFILIGYQFYYVTTVNNVRIFLITKKLMKNPSTYTFDNLKRINDFTFIDRSNCK